MDLMDTNMTDIIRERAQADIQFRQSLIDTGSALLVENVRNPPTSYWAIGEGRGQNVMGRILMQVQRELQNSEAEAQGTCPAYMGNAKNEPH